MYDEWGKSLAKDDKWEAALAKYLEGIAAHPKNPLLAGNVIALMDQWSAKPIEQKDWKEAVRIYDVGLKHFPDNKHLKHNREFCAKQQK